MDKYIIGENSSGKTRKMLEEAMKSGAIVVCRHPLHMQSKANAYGLYGIKFMSYDEFNDGGVDRKSTRLNSSHICSSRMPSSA